MAESPDVGEIIEVDLVEGLNGPYWLPRGRWVLDFKGTFDTAVITVRTALSMTAGDFTAATAVKDPNATADTLEISANRGDLIIDGPTGIAINVATIGSATGLKFRRAFAGQR